MSENIRSIYPCVILPSLWPKREKQLGRKELLPLWQSFGEFLKILKYFKIPTLGEAPDQRAPTETSLSLILAPKLSWQSNGVKDTRWPGHLIPLLLCDLTYHFSQDQIPILPYHSQPHILQSTFFQILLHHFLWFGDVGVSSYSSVYTSIF